MVRPPSRGVASFDLTSQPFPTAPLAAPSHARARDKEKTTMLFGSTALEVLIGMVFVYLLMSMLCSAVSEYMETLFNYRAKDLRKGIELLLNDSGDAPRRDGPPAPEGEATQTRDLAADFYAHGLIRPLYRSATKLPSYIPARTFALALWNMAGGEGGGTTDLARIKEIIKTKVPNRELRQALTTMIDEAQGDFERARKNIEDWYDGAMDRVSGWYKRRVHIILLVTGIVVSAVVNADTIQIARALIQNPTLRAAVVESAEARAQEGRPEQTAPPADADAAERTRLAREKVRQARADLEAIGLPLGWVRNTPANADDPRRVPASPGGWVLKIIGLLLTGLAVSQGAPFWFDILNKFIVIRSTVKPKEKSEEQPSKDRPAPETEEERNRVNKG
jgi:hypothetical protein